MYQAIRAALLSNARCWDPDSKRSYQDLFEKLDTNKDGKVDVAELRAGLKAMGIFRQGAAQVTCHKSCSGVGEQLTDPDLPALHEIPQ